MANNPNLPFSRVAGRARAEDILANLDRACSMLSALLAFYDKQREEFAVKEQFLLHAIEAAYGFVEQAQLSIGEIDLREAPLQEESDDSEALVVAGNERIFENEAHSHDSEVQSAEETVQNIGRVLHNQAQLHSLSQTADPQSRPVLRPAFVSKAAPPVEQNPAELDFDDYESADLDYMDSRLIADQPDVDLNEPMPEPKVPPVPDGPALSYLELLRKLTAAEIFAAEQQALAPPGTQHVLLPLLRDLREDIQRMHSVA